MISHAPTDAVWLAWLRRRCDLRAPRRELLAAALLGLFEAIEQAAGVFTRQCFQPVRLALLDGVACDRSFGTKEFGLPLHLAVPPVWIVFAHIHENAHLRD